MPSSRTECTIKTGAICNIMFHFHSRSDIEYENQMQLCCHGEVPSLGLSTLALTTAMKDLASIVSARNFSRAERSSADEKSPWLLALKLPVTLSH